MDQQEVYDTSPTLELPRCWHSLKKVYKLKPYENWIYTDHSAQRRYSSNALIELGLFLYYHQIANISHILEGIKLVDHSDVDGASPVGAAPTTSSLLT